MWPIKFYYLDDENELISITSQGDFQEALNIEDFSMLKLTVAANVQEARMQLERQLSETASMTESLNQSQSRASILNSSAIRREDTNSNFWDTERSDFKKISHEMGCGNDNVKNSA